MTEYKRAGDFGATDNSVIDHICEIRPTILSRLLKQGVGNVVFWKNNDYSRMYSTGQDQNVWAHTWSDVLTAASEVLNDDHKDRL